VTGFPATNAVMLTEPINSRMGYPEGIQKRRSRKLFDASSRPQKRTAKILFSPPLTNN
jgi:hypothetical protein